MVASAPYVVEQAGSRSPTLGLVVLQADETIEDEFRHYLRDRMVVLHHTRIPSGVNVNFGSLMAMEAQLKTAIRLFPIGACFDVIGYACTSGASVIGESKVTKIIQDEFPQATGTNPATAVKAALSILGVKRIALLTPYNFEVTQGIVKMFENNDFEVEKVTTFNQEYEAQVARILPESILEAVVTAPIGTSADAVFVSCTNLRCASIITKAEKALGLPVISSNLALLWHMLDIAGVEMGGISDSHLFNV